MIARMRKSMDQKDQGFTLIELLVVMIIIGILAAIAIPVFLNQRKKAVDTAAKADVSTLGKEVATYYVDATVTLPAANLVRTAGGRYTLTPVVVAPAVAVVQDLGKSSNGVTSITLAYTNGNGLSATVTDASVNWCVTLNYSGGTGTQTFYSALNGLSTTSC